MLGIKYFKTALGEHTKAERKALKARAELHRAIAPSMGGREIRWKSNGSGVVYEPARPISAYNYRKLEMDRVARETVARSTDRSHHNTIVPSNAKARAYALRKAGLA